jgi:hypothetical protein
MYDPSFQRLSCITTKKLQHGLGHFPFTFPVSRSRETRRKQEENAAGQKKE